MTAPTERQPISPLVASIITANATQLAATTNTLLDDLTAERDRLRAELDTIRVGVTELLNGPWMPTPDAIERALYPSRAAVDRFRNRGGL